MNKLKLKCTFLSVLVYFIINYIIILISIKTEILNKVSEYVLKFYNIYILQKKNYRYSDLTLIPISLIISWFILLFFILISFYFLKKKNLFDKSYYIFLLFHLGLLFYYINYFF